MPASQRSGKLKNLFNRTFLGVTILWIAYVTVFVPIQQKRRAEDRFAQAVAECTHHFRASAEVDEEVERNCMVEAGGVYVIGRITAASYYGPQGWPSLLIACVGLPLFVYGALFAAAALVRRTIDHRRFA